jgi:hypothetical protein
MGVEERKRGLLIFVLVVLFFGNVLSGCIDIRCSYITESIISEGWYENTALRNSGIQFFGFEKWCSSTYEINGKYPASLTITTIKTLLLAGEEEIENQTRQTIKDTFTDRIQLTLNTTGERKLHNNHKTIFTVYDGYDVQKQENVRIIGEVWTCDSSGTSIICIGIAYITNKDISDVENFEHWYKIVMDSYGTIDKATGDSGLIDNVCCH